MSDKITIDNKIFLTEEEYDSISMLDYELGVRKIIVALSIIARKVYSEELAVDLEELNAKEQKRFEKWQAEEKEREADLPLQTQTARAKAKINSTIQIPMQ
jgi:hypothetical protein